MLIWKYRQIVKSLKQLCGQPGFNVTTESLNHRQWRRQRWTDSKPLAPQDDAHLQRSSEVTPLRRAILKLQYSLSRMSNVFVCAVWNSVFYIFVCLLGAMAAFPWQTHTNRWEVVCQPEDSSYNEMAPLHTLVVSLQPVHWQLMHRRDLHLCEHDIVARKSGCAPKCAEPEGARGAHSSHQHTATRSSTGLFLQLSFIVSLNLIG